MKRLLLRTCHQVATRDHKTLTPNEYKALRKRYRTLLIMMSASTARR